MSPILLDRPSSELEAEVDLAAKAVGVGSKRWEQFKGILFGLKEHHEDTYRHSLRVGLYSLAMAQAEGWEDVKLPFLGGLGHDLGKMGVAKAILGAKGLSSEDWEKIREHPRAGYEVLREGFLFSGLVAGLHHRLRPDGYGIELSEELAEMALGLSESSREKIVAATEMVMLADFFDALTTRENTRTVALTYDAKDPREARRVLNEHFKRWPDRVEVLVGRLPAQEPTRAGRGEIFS